MDLQEYFSQKRGRQAALAKAIGAHSPDLSRWAKGIRPVPHKYGYQIELETNGAVTRQEMFSDWRERWPDLARQEPVKHNRRATDRAP